MSLSISRSNSFRENIINILSRNMFVMKIYSIINLIILSIIKIIISIDSVKYKIDRLLEKEKKRVIMIFFP